MSFCSETNHTRSVVLCELYKDHKNIVDTLAPIQPISPTANTSSYELKKFMVLMLKHLTANENAVNNLFILAKEIIEQDSNFFLWEV